MIKFLIIGSQNAITYKEIFPYIKNNQLWLGLTMNGSNRWFEVPSTYEVKENAAGYKVVDGKRMLFVNGVTWFTNIENPRRNTPLDLYKKYNEKDFPKYDNYDAINVDKVTDIPEDYDGVIGVPITFLYKYCPKQFEILDARGYGLDDRQRNKSTMLIKDADSAINGKPTYARILIKKYVEFEIVGWSSHNDLDMDGGCWQGGKNDATIKGKKLYRRILIKKINN